MPLFPPPGGSGVHPDLTEHDTMGLATDDEVTTALATKSDTTHNHDASYYTEGETDTLLAGKSDTGHSHGGGSEAFPVGAVFIGVVSTNPGTLLGYGTWAAFGAGRVLVGHDSGDTDFDTAEETGGAKTHTLTTTEMPAHTHVENSNNATTGPLRGWGAPDTSTNTETATGYNTGSTGGGGAHNNLQPYIVVYMWKRTA